MFCLEYTSSDTQLCKPYGEKTGYWVAPEIYRKFAFRVVAFATTQQISSIIPNYLNSILLLIFPTDCTRFFIPDSYSPFSFHFISRRCNGQEQEDGQLVHQYINFGNALFMENMEHLVKKSSKCDPLRNSIKQIEH